MEAQVVDLIWYLPDIKGGGVNSDAVNPALVKEGHGKGIFIDELDKMLKERNLKINFKAINEKTAVE